MNTVIWRCAVLLLCPSLVGCGDGPGSDDVPAERDESAVVPAERDESAFAAAARLGRGVNLGNALEAPREGDWGYRITRADVRLVKRLGFDSVRLPVRWSSHMGPPPEYAVRPGFAARVDEVLDWCLEEGLAVIVDDHHHEAVVDDPEDNGRRLLALWDQLAARYVDRPPELYYEVFNEPHGALDAEAWNGLLAEALATIRRHDPDRFVLVGPARWNMIWMLKRLELPVGARRLIVSVHYYEPFEFTHQGADWAGRDADSWLGTAWTGSREERAALDVAFDVAAGYARRTGRPVHLGEFGAYSKADYASRVRWTRAVREAVESRGISWAYWEFASGFGIYDPETGEIRDELAAALLEGAP